jgi:two-component system LytT family response regulator
MSIRVLIVDDEPLARRGIRARLANAAGFDIVGEATGGREAIAAIIELAPDLVFLDVQMAGVDGFGVVDAVGADRMPITIFVTAYDEHALRAFDARALDYLLKPIDDQRFQEALERAQRRVEEQRGSALGRKIAAAVADAGGTQPADDRTTSPGKRRTVERFLIKTGGRVVIVPVEEVDWFEAAGDYVKLHVGSKTHLLREKISAVEETLDEKRFVRIHRSTIVNVERIRELQPYVNREYTLLLKDGTVLKLSRGYRARLEELFGGQL